MKAWFGVKMEEEKKFEIVALYHDHKFASATRVRIQLGTSDSVCSFGRSIVMELHGHNSVSLIGVSNLSLKSYPYRIEVAYTLLCIIGTVSSLLFYGLCGI